MPSGLFADDVRGAAEHRGLWQSDNPYSEFSRSERRMPYSVELMELSYSRTFSPPIFEVASSVAPLLRKLYETFSPELVVKLSNMQALPATSMSDVGVKLQLFNGSFDLQITPERIAATARALRTESDLKVVRRSIELAHTALNASFEQVGLGDAGLTVHGWLKSNSDSDPSASAIFEAMKLSKPFAVLAGESDFHPVRMRIRNAPQRYACELTCDETRVPDSQLYFNMVLTVDAGGTHSTIDQIADLGADLVKRWFAYLGVPTIDRGSEK